MAKSLITAVPKNLGTSLDDVIAWIDRVHQGFIGAGCIQTDDSNQLGTPETLLAVIGQQNLYGFRIYEVNDSYSADYPVYMKVYFYVNCYGTAIGNNAFCPFVGIQIGFETDGLGDFVGPYGPTSPMYFSYSTGNSVTSYNSNSYSASSKSDGFFCYFSEIGYGYHYSSNISGGGFIVERRRDHTGEIIPDHLILYLPSSAIPTNTIGSMRYMHIKKDGLMSALQSNPSSLPTIGYDGVQILANRFEASELGSIHQSSGLVATRSGSAYSEIELSFDSVTSKKFLLLPMCSASTTSNLGSYAQLGINARIDTRNSSLGYIGVLWE